MSDGFQHAFEITRGREGGFVNDALDPGGATRYGITESVARGFGYKGRMSRLPVNLAMTIYRQRFWDKMRLGQIRDQALAEELFDTGVNCGLSRAGRWLQKAMNTLNDRGSRWPEVVVDGKIGTETIATLNRALRSRKAAARILKAVNVYQGAHYLALAERDEKFERFVGGWLDQRVEINTA